MIWTVSLSTDVVLAKFVIFILVKICNISRDLYEYLKNRSSVRTECPPGSEQNPCSPEAGLETMNSHGWLKSVIMPMIFAYLCEILCICDRGDISSGTAVLLGINVVEYRLCRFARSGNAANRNVWLLLRENKFLQRYLDMLKKEREKNRRLRHDLKKQYFLERFYLEQGQYDLLKKEYDRICAVVISKEVISGHVMMDAILTYERTEADRRQIELQMEVSVPADLSILDHHLNALLGNILDNAVRYTQMGGVIRIKILYDRKNLFIKCQNAPLSLPQRRDASQNKNEHGIGLQIVRDVVAYYNGSMKIEQTKIEYAVMIILELNYQKLH